MFERLKDPELFTSDVNTELERITEAIPTGHWVVLSREMKALINVLSKSFRKLDIKEV
jgi:hypothetical protein